jgi:hypothetical protein
MIATHIDEYNIELTFNWKKFPLEDEKLSLMIIYSEQTSNLDKVHSLVNKLLKVFPDKCYYDNEKMPWLQIPKDTSGYKAPYLEKVMLKSKDSDKHTLIVDLDNSNVEDPKEFEEYPIIDEISIENNTEESNIYYPMFATLDSKLRENIEITKITEYKTFITHMIFFGNEKTIPKSYYEKFDILMFTDIETASKYSGSRTQRSFGIDNKNMIKDKIFMTDTRIMRNNMCLYSL